MLDQPRKKNIVLRFSVQMRSLPRLMYFALSHNSFLCMLKNLEASLVSVYTIFS